MTHPDNLLSCNRKRPFGTVTFDTLADEPSVSYRVWSIDGAEIGTVAVPLAKLR